MIEKTLNKAGAPSMRQQTKPWPGVPGHLGTRALRNVRDVLGEAVRDLIGQIDEQVRERTKVEKARLDEMTAEVEKTQENLQKAHQSIQLVAISDPAEWPEWGRVRPIALHNTNVWFRGMDSLRG